MVLIFTDKIMKKVLLFTTTAVLCLINLNAQTVEFGAKAGVNLSTFTGENTSEFDVKTSYYVGVVVEIPISDKFFFQPEMLYSEQGSSAEFSYSERLVNNDFVEYATQTDSGTIKYILDYVTIPLIAKYYIAEGFSIEAGPQVGFLISSRFKGEGKEMTVYDDGSSSDIYLTSEDLDAKDFFETIDYGVTIGLGYKLDNGLNFGARYYKGVSEISKDTQAPNWKNSVVQLGVGYFF